ncbi:DUF2178 domain-containing protein [Halopiger goleimassiliensis]|uniref:DUF2178 domain-containing protein n=1 Tax=Halopiger goleimassiliensis TaxID=1293048 RepID=UPI0006778A18|nr:DUF2178 domain-containing protein [Halopiger goleimassiliensis]
MAFDKMRIWLLFAVVGGVGIGFTAGVMDLGDSGGVIALGFGLLVGAVTYWYYRKMKQTGEVDERYMQIQGRAAMWTQSFFFVGLGVLAIVLVFTDVALPVGMILIGMIFAGIAIDELCIELYRRRM